MFIVSLKNAGRINCKQWQPLGNKSGLWVTDMFFFYIIHKCICIFLFLNKEHIISAKKYIFIF